MSKQSFKLSTKILAIIVVAAVIAVALTLIVVITASLSDEQRFSYELKADGTYEIVDVKNAYRGGWFAKESIVVPATHKGTNVTSIKTMNLQRTKYVEISEGIKTIGVSAFYGSAIEKIKLPSTLKSIGNNAFNGCHNLTEINLPEGMTALANGTFKDCQSLASLTIPSTVKSIGNEVFNGCVSLTALTIPDGVTTIGNSAFINCTELKTLTLPTNLESIGATPFAGCAKLTYNESGDGLYLGSTANQYLVLVGAKDSVTTLEVNGNTIAIVDSALSNKESLTSVTIPQSVVSIGANAFLNCKNLTSATFAVTTGWVVASSNLPTAVTTPISAGDLADTAIAARLLKADHVTDIWTCSTSAE